MLSDDVREKIESQLNQQIVQPHCGCRFVYEWRFTSGSAPYPACATIHGKSDSCSDGRADHDAAIYDDFRHQLTSKLAAFVARAD